MVRTTIRLYNKYTFIFILCPSECKEYGNIHDTSVLLIFKTKKYLLNAIFNLILQKLQERTKTTGV